MLIKTSSDISPSEITPEAIYLRRREFMHSAATLMAGGALAGCVDAGDSGSAAQARAVKGDGKAILSVAPSNPYHSKEALTPYEDVTSYNNFYEFGSAKQDPAKYAHELSTDNWQILVEGEADKPGLFNLEDILAKNPLEERIYRLRCVEAWSMVIPWQGFSLANMLKQFEPNSKAKYVKFTTLHRPEQMRGQRARSSTIDWPYVEGLRIDEAMNPLAFIATGLYGKDLPNQSGAPMRLVVPWKYGFKSIKSIVKIEFTQKRPTTSWEKIAPREYGFYANVNPEVDHPRWSQANERRLPSSLFSPNRIATQMFNGYGEQVAHLYEGMNLRRNI